MRVRGFMEHRRKARVGEARAGRACRSEARRKETYKQTRCLWYAFQTMLNLGLISAIKLELYHHYNAI